MRDIFARTVTGAQDTAIATHARAAAQASGVGSVIRALGQDL